MLYEREVVSVTQYLMVLWKYDLGDDLNPSEGDRPVALSALVKAEQLEGLQLTLRSKKLHGIYSRVWTDRATDAARSCKWLTDRKLAAKTEALVMALQDGVLHTNVYRAKITKDGTNPQCRLCEEETVAHILSTCQANRALYRQRHNKALFILLKAVLVELGILIPKYLKARGGSVQSGVEETKSVKVLVDQVICTERRMFERRPDLVVVWKS